MQRQLKFRAWDRDRLCMEHWLLHDGKLLYPIEESEQHYKQEWIVMQYTGLHDKNGKEIYEGDIVELKNYPIEINADHMQGIKEVWFNPEELRFEGKSHTIFDWGGTESITVIGNIYSNPELLANK